MILFPNNLLNINLKNKIKRFSLVYVICSNCSKPHMASEKQGNPQRASPQLNLVGGASKKTS